MAEDDGSAAVDGSGVGVGDVDPVDGGDLHLSTLDRLQMAEFQATVSESVGSLAAWGTVGSSR